MRESFGATWEFQIIIIFILIFVSYLTVSVSYYKVFKAKNDIISIIERKEGMTEVMLIMLKDIVMPVHMVLIA